MIEINLLEQLDAFARLGTLSAAAEELHVSQPALSRSMRKLEGELGAPLFDRRHTRIALNDTGKLVAQMARRVLDDDRELVERAREYDRRQRGIALGSCGPWPVMELARPLRRCFPDKAITSEVINDDERLIHGLHEHDYQLVVVRRVPDSTGMRALRIGEENQTVAFKRGHTLASRASIRYEDLAGESVLALGNDSFWSEVVRRRCPDTNILFQTDLDALEDLVTHTGLPTFSSDAMAGSGYQEDDRVDVPIDDPEAHATFWLCCLETEAGRYESLFENVQTKEPERRA